MLEGKDWTNEPYIVVYTGNGIAQAQVQFLNALLESWKKAFADPPVYEIFSCQTPEGRPLFFPNADIEAVTVTGKEARFAAWERNHAFNDEAEEWHRSKQRPLSYEEQERMKYGG